MSDHRHQRTGRHAVSRRSEPLHLAAEARHLLPVHRRPASAKATRSAPRARRREVGEAVGLDRSEVSKGAGEVWQMEDLPKATKLLRS
jgi:hypothetical protein